MLKALGSRVTYANAVATGALFLALGGGAYALSGIPDRGGVYHGCVDPKAGALRVVKSAGSCRKTKTIKRGRRRVRIPGESAIAWNQQGRQGSAGPQGNPGNQGQQGTQGRQGPGATTFTASLVQGTTGGTLITLANGLKVTGTCTNGPANIQVDVRTTSAALSEQASGTATNSGSPGVFRADANGTNSLGTIQDTSQVDLNVIARDTNVGTFDRIAVHGSFGVPCTYWGMITPSS